MLQGRTTPTPSCGSGSSATMRRRASASSARLCGPSLSTPCWRPRRPSCFRTITSRDAPGRAGSPVGAGASRRHIEPTPAAGPRSRPDTSTPRRSPLPAGTAFEGLRPTDRVLLTRRPPPVPELLYMARAFRSVAPLGSKGTGRIVRNGVGRLKPLRPRGEGYGCLCWLLAVAGSLVVLIGICTGATPQMPVCWAIVFTIVEIPIPLIAASTSYRHRSHPMRF